MSILTSFLQPKTASSKVKSILTNVSFPLLERVDDLPPNPADGMRGIGAKVCQSGEEGDRGAEEGIGYEYVGFV